MNLICKGRGDGDRAVQAGALMLYRLYTQAIKVELLKSIKKDEQCGEPQSGFRPGRLLEDNMLRQPSV